MTELVQVLFDVLAGTAFGPWLTIIALVAFVITHLVPHLPVSVTSKIPNVVMVILNSIAGQYKNAKNEKTDMKGNPK